MKKRLGAAKKLLEEHSLDALLVWNMTNVRYLSGFTGTEGALVIAENKAFFLTDSRYEIQADQEAEGFEIRISPEKIGNIVSTLKSLSIKRIGFEDEILPVARLKELESEHDGARFVRLGKALDHLRLRKDDSEIPLLRRAAWASEVGFKNALKSLRPGVTEAELAVELEIGMLRAGASKPSFDLIVASGPRGALPHGIASEKTIREGEMIVIDFGCVLDGYCSDQTVTVALGDVGDEAQKVYEIVHEAQAKALGALKPGVKLREVDRVARDHIHDAGYGDFFGHGLGHGVGMEVHEDPRVSKKSEFSAEPGMVLTVEPGIYLPGKFGVRIEDTVLITPNGYEKITSLDKKFLKV